MSPPGGRGKRASAPAPQLRENPVRLAEVVEALVHGVAGPLQGAGLPPAGEAPDPFPVVGADPADGLGPTLGLPLHPAPDPAPPGGPGPQGGGPSAAGEAGAAGE